MSTHKSVLYAYAMFRVYQQPNFNFKQVRSLKISKRSHLPHTCTFLLIRDLPLVGIPSLPTRLLRPEMAPLYLWKRIGVSFVCLMLLTWFLMSFKFEYGRRAVDRAYDDDSPLNHWVTVTVIGHEGVYTDTAARTESRRSQHNRDDVKLTAELKNWPSDSFCEDFLENTFNYISYHIIHII